MWLKVWWWHRLARALQLCLRLTCRRLSIAAATLLVRFILEVSLFRTRATCRATQRASLLGRGTVKIPPPVGDRWQNYCRLSAFTRVWKVPGASGLGRLRVRFSTEKKPLAIQISLLCSLQLFSLVSVNPTTCKKWAEELSMLPSSRAKVEENRLSLWTLAVDRRGTVEELVLVVVILVESPVMGWVSCSSTS